jgi:hypothetical protein
VGVGGLAARRLHDAVQAHELGHDQLAHSVSFLGCAA